MNNLISENYFFLVILLSSLFIFGISLKRRNRLPWSLLIIIIGSFFINTRQIELPHLNFKLSLPLWITVVFFCIFDYKNLQTYFVSKKNIFRSLLFGIVISICIAPIVVFGPLADPRSSFRCNPDSFSWQLVIWAILGGFSEEILYRGIILGYLRKYDYTPRVALLAQSIIFTISHQFYIEEFMWRSLLGALLFGLAAGGITWKTKNIGGAIVAHTLINSLLVVFTS